MDFSYEIITIKGFCCPNKTLVKINGQNICFCNSKNRAKKIIEFAFSFDESLIEDKVLKNSIRNIVVTKAA